MLYDGTAFYNAVYEFAKYIKAELVSTKESDYPCLAVATHTALLVLELFSWNLAVTLKIVNQCNCGITIKCCILIYKYYENTENNMNLQGYKTFSMPKKLPLFWFYLKLFI